MMKYIVPALAAAVVALAAPLGHAAPAVVINPAGGCGLFDGNGGFAFTTDTRVVATQSANTNTKLTCKADVTPSAGGTAVRYDGTSSGLCGIFAPPNFYVTDQWHETVSASGQATLTCFYKAP